MLLLVVCFGFNLVGVGGEKVENAGEKVEKAEMAQLWIGFVVAVHEKNQLSTEVFHSNIPIILKRALTPTMIGRFEKAIQPPLLME